MHCIFFMLLPPYSPGNLLLKQCSLSQSIATLFFQLRRPQAMKSALPRLSSTSVSPVGLTLDYVQSLTTSYHLCYFRHDLRNPCLPRGLLRVASSLGFLLPPLFPLSSLWADHVIPSPFWGWKSETYSALWGLLPPALLLIPRQPPCWSSA